MAEPSTIDEARAEVARLRGLYDAAVAVRAWRARRLRADLDAAEAVLAALLPPVPQPAPKIKSIPFREYDVARGAEFRGALPPMATDRSLIPAYVPPEPGQNPDTSDYCVAPGRQRKGALR